MSRGSIIKRGKTYTIIFYRAGKQKWIGGFPTRTEARRRLDVELGLDISGEDTSLELFVADWLQSARLRIKPSTYERYKIALDKHIVPILGDLMLTRITAARLESFIDEKIKEGCAPASINKLIMVLKIIFKRARRYKIIADNPAEYLRQLTVPKKVKDFLKPSELALLLEIAKKDFPAWYPFFMVAVFTGARIGELMALRWSDINWSTNEIRFASSIYRGQPTTTKTNSIGFVEVPSEALAALKKQPKIINPLDLIFLTSACKPHDRSNIAKRIFPKILRAAGLRAVTFHSLRDSYNVIMLSTGANIKVVQEQLRHKNINMTLHTYGHSLQEDKRRAVGEAARMVLG